MMVDFSFIELYLSVKSWKSQGGRIVMGFQHSLRLRHLLGQTRMVLRII